MACAILVNMEWLPVNGISGHGTVEVPVQIRKATIQQNISWNIFSRICIDQDECIARRFDAEVLERRRSRNGRLKQPFRRRHASSYHFFPPMWTDSLHFVKSPDFSRPTVEEAAPFSGAAWPGKSEKSACRND